MVPSQGIDYMGPHRGRTHEEQMRHRRRTRDLGTTVGRPPRLGRRRIRNDFDHFHYDYNPYIEELPAAPFPLPDSPSWATPTHLPHSRRLQKYRPTQYSTRVFSGQGPEDEEEGGLVNPPTKRSPKNNDRQQRQQESSSIASQNSKRAQR
ncbi:uncharacterized protein ARMOST_22505 [Armillaria ostoyae]|uniref:Uncharacterized protein n=1 Tax=Armillaria ostoyae TaxID=47428 RepID=A0A284SD41_ARMOS|nr:uncharacterized protein ARMOST_22505 [Armillaria ostoyae]